MVWRSGDPQGHESQKVMFELVPYMGGKVLDLGCGPKKIFPRAFGIDDAHDMKQFGFPDADLIESATSLPVFADEQWDTVFSSHLLEHVADHVQVLREWWRLVKPGGYLILYLPHADWYPNIGMPGYNSEHKHDFRNQDIVDAMSTMESGWDLVHDEVRTEDNEYSFLQIYRKRSDAAKLSMVPDRPKRSLGVVRLGAYGDALWITGVLREFKKAGWHITLYGQRQAEEVLRHDPNVDRIVVQPDGVFGAGGPETGVYQHAYWRFLERKHDRFINMVGCVERHMLPFPGDPNFFLPDEQRRNIMGGNYLEAVYRYAGLPFDPEVDRTTFTPSNEELSWALGVRAAIDGPVVMINPGGSSLSKWWPHAQRLMNILDSEGIHSILIGDLKANKFTAPSRGRIVAKDWTIRQAFTMARLCDVVVGTESAIINSVAYETPLKIAILSHSTHENLTRDWTATVSLAAQALPCYPCHRIHQDWSYCTRSGDTAACQDAASAEGIAAYAVTWIRGEWKAAA